MRIGIVGSRKYPDKEKVEKLVDSLDKDDVVVSGGAYGPDSWAEQRAAQRGLRTIIFKPELEEITPPKTWERIVNAYHQRNMKIAQNSDVIHAFVNGSKGGTWNTINWAKQFGRKIIIYN